MAEVKVTCHRDQLKALEVEVGKQYSYQLGEPKGVIKIVVTDHEGHAPVAGQDFKVSGPHGVSFDGTTGEKGEIAKEEPQVPIDHYNLEICGQTIVVESRLPGFQPNVVRVPGWPKATPAPPAPTPIASKRKRVSVWVDHPGRVIGTLNLQTGEITDRGGGSSRMARYKGHLDDVSVIATVVFGHPPKNRLGEVILSPRVLPYKDIKPTVLKFFQDAADLCHQNQVQFLAGYAMGDEGAVVSERGRAFANWMANPGSPTLKEHATEVVKFTFDDLGVGFDGIGFDIELNTLKASHADNMCAFYGELADQLAARGKILTVATGIGMIGAEESNLLGTFLAQPFRLAKNHPNVIVRPMAYDCFNLDDAAFLKWHKGIIDYALDKVGLAPNQLQLGLKTVKNVHPQDPNWKPGPGWTETKCTFDAAGIADRCVNVIKPRGVGLVTFAGWGPFEDWDVALNPEGPLAGAEPVPNFVPGVEDPKPTPPAPPPEPPKPEPEPKPPEDPNAIKSREEYPHSPQDLRQRYLNMSFKVGDEQVSFSLDCLRYHNLGIQDKEPNYIGNREGVKEAVRRAKNKIKAKDAAFYAELVGEYAKEEKVFLPHPFFGKGSPTQIEAVLKVVATVKGELGEYWVDKGSLNESLKHFYYNNMGLDCSGFAGNYARWVAGPPDQREFSGGGFQPGYNPDMSISQFGTMGKKRTKVEEIMMGDLIVWTDGKHIATIQGHSGNTLDVVESNGDQVIKGLGRHNVPVSGGGGGTWTIGSRTVYIVSPT